MPYRTMSPQCLNLPTVFPYIVKQSLVLTEGLWHTIPAQWLTGHLPNTPFPCHPFPILSLQAYAFQWSIIKLCCKQSPHWWLFFWLYTNGDASKKLLPYQFLLSYVLIVLRVCSIHHDCTFMFLWVMLFKLYSDTFSFTRLEILWWSHGVFLSA